MTLNKKILLILKKIYIFGLLQVVFHKISRHFMSPIVLSFYVLYEFLLNQSR